MAKLTLNTNKTNILKKAYTDLEDVFRSGLEVNGIDTNLDLNELEKYSDDSVMGGTGPNASNRKIVKQYTARTLAPLLNRMSEPQFIYGNPTANTTGVLTDLPLATIPFEQLIDNQLIEVHFDVSTWSSSTDNNITFALIYDGISQGTRVFRHNVNAIHFSFSTKWLFSSTSLAGTKTLKIQWAGSSGVAHMDGNDQFTLLAR